MRDFFEAWGRYLFFPPRGLWTIGFLVLVFLSVVPGLGIVAVNHITPLLEHILNYVVILGIIYVGFQMMVQGLKSGGGKSRKRRK